MKARLFLPAALVALSFSAAVAQTPPRPTSAPAVKSDIEGMEKALADLKTEAEAFYKQNDDKGPTASSALSGVSYTADNLQSVTKLLGAKYGPDNVDLYVQYQLLLPMKKLDAEALRRARTVFQQMLKRCGYHDLPVWPKDKLAVLALNTGAKGLDQIKDIERRQKALDEKNGEEFKVVKYNRTSEAMQKAIMDILLAMGDSGGDDTVFAKLTAEDQDTSGDIQTTLAVIKDHASEFKQARAKEAFKKLVDLAGKAPPKKNYLLKTTPNYNQNGNSTWKSDTHYPRIELLTVANMMAQAAVQKEVPLPDVKTLEAEATAAAAKATPTKH